MSRAARRGTLRIGRTAEGAMREADFLAVAPQDDGVLAGIAARPDGVDADLAGGSSTCSLASMTDATVEIFPACGGDRARERQGGAGRGVHLVAVVRFDDLDVVAGERANERRQDGEGRVHAWTHVGGVEDGDALGGRSQHRHLARVESGRAADQRYAATGARPRLRQRLPGGEVKSIRTSTSGTSSAGSQTTLTPSTSALVSTVMTADAARPARHRGRKQPG